MPPKKIGQYKLFFVETPSPEENCFVISTGKTLAARFEEGATGFNRGDCVATYVRHVDQEWFDQYVSNKEEGARVWYLTPDFYKELGIRHTVIDGDDVFTYNGQEYRKESNWKYLQSIGETVKGGGLNVIIESWICFKSWKGTLLANGCIVVSCHANGR
jgi:hypothetical protein